MRIETKRGGSYTIWSSILGMSSWSMSFAIVVRKAKTQRLVIESAKRSVLIEFYALTKQVKD